MDRTNVITFSHFNFAMIIIKDFLRSCCEQFYFQIEFENIQVTCFVFSSSGYQWSNLEAGFDFFKYGKLGGLFFIFNFFNSFAVTSLTILDTSAVKFVFYEAAQLKMLAFKQIFFLFPLKMYFHNVIYDNDCAGL